jgi:hypothetical protein
MKRLMRNLSRFLRRAPWVRPATRADLAEVTELALRHCAEKGRRLAPDGAERVAALALNVISRPQGADIFVAWRGRAMVGMVWCAMYPPDAGDDRTVMMVDWLYVRPEERGRPATVLALLRRSLAAAQTWRAAVVRFHAEGADETLLRQYERIIGAQREGSLVRFSLAPGREV